MTNRCQEPIDLRTFLLWSGLALGAILALGLPSVVALSGREAVPAAITGAVIAWLGSLAGALALAASARRDPGNAPTATLLATGVRFAVIAVLASAVALGASLPLAPLLVSAALAHLGLLVADTLWTVRTFQPPRGGETSR